MTQGINKATGGSTCLDHFMIKSKHKCQTFIFDSLTDHCPILLILDTENIKNAVPLKKRPKSITTALTIN